MVLLLNETPFSTALLPLSMCGVRV